MKAFFSKYGYTMIKLFLNQFAIALFGIALATACANSGNYTLLLIVSIAAIVFYLFLQYAVMWEVGAKDGISAVARHESRRLWRGLVIAVGGNIVNILLAVLILPSSFVQNGVSAICKTVSMLIQGMYMGILAQPVGDGGLVDFWWMHILIILPALLVCSGAYILGNYNLHATNILIPKNTDVKNNGRPE